MHFKLCLAFNSITFHTKIAKQTFFFSPANDQLFGDLKAHICLWRFSRCVFGFVVAMVRLVCVTIIANLAKVCWENKQKSSTDSGITLPSCLQLQSSQVILSDPIDSIQVIEFQCIADERGTGVGNLPEHSNGLESRCSVSVDR